MSGWIRFGFEIEVTCAAPVPMLFALSTHTGFSGRLIGEDRVRCSAGADVAEYVDLFGNRISRTVAPAGSTVFWSDCVTWVDGKPDEVAPYAIQHRNEDLPSETLTFLTASRYCDSDSLADFAWKQFGGVPEGWSRVQGNLRFRP